MNRHRRTFTGAAFCAGAAALSLYAVRGRSSQIFGPSSYHGPGRRRSIALTFDDGPSPGSLRLLEYLAKQDVRATFFQCGANVLRHPEIAIAVHAAGHEIGNHTFSHPRLPPRLGWQPDFRLPSEVVREFARTQVILQTIAGVQPTFLRPPYGLRWFGLRSAYHQLGLHGVMWTVIGRDWVLRRKEVADLVLGHSSPGGIVCLHDGRETRPFPDISETIEAVKLIVPALRDCGYAFETISEILR